MGDTRPARRRWRPRRGLRIFLLLSPALAVVVVLFLGGFVLAVVQSFGYLPLFGPSRFSLDAYRQLFHDDAFRTSLFLTLRLAVSATVISSVLAVSAALLIRSTRVGRKTTTWLFQFNLTVPHIVGAGAMLLLLSQSGMLSRLAYAVGLTDSIQGFPALVNDRWGVGILAEYVWKEVPFIGIVALAVLARRTQELEDVARTLGAGSWQRFRFVILPLLMPAVLSTSIIVFAFSFGSYEIPALLGRSFPTTLPVMAYDHYVDVDLNARPQAMAIAVVIALFIGVMVFAYLRLAERYLLARR